MRKRFEVEEQLVQSRAEQLVLLQQSRRENGGEPKQPAAAAPTAEMKEKPKHGSTSQPTNQQLMHPCPMLYLGDPCHYVMKEKPKHQPTNQPTADASLPHIVSWGPFPL